MIERTLAVIKPDGVQRGLVGDITQRFERAGLKLVALKLVWVDEELVGKHYTDNEKYLEEVGSKALAAAKERGEDLGASAHEIGMRIREVNMRYLSAGPVVAMVLEGNTAIQTVRNIIGGTNPLTADVGTIRGDLTVDDFVQADSEERSVKNLMHASSDPEEAAREIDLWFKKDEQYDYRTAVDWVLHNASWENEQRQS